ncbi:BON domain-containing protein [Streptosporangiaceae bacterium NEAU-GS5]|nr:BON domain-containing protein [Streptosporangiaceae bacterium NEAU-GS5]
MDTPHYVAARVQQALAEDDRTNELGIQVYVRGNQLFLRGQVTGDAQLDVLGQVAAETAPGMTVHNEITVVEVTKPETEEHLG